MPQAVVDPEELRQFARSLQKFMTDLRDRSTSLGNQLSALGTTWRDQEHKKFVEEFSEHMKIIARFVESTEQHIPYLMRKAQHADDYLNS